MGGAPKGAGGAQMQVLHMLVAELLTPFSNSSGCSLSRALSAHCVCTSCECTLTGLGCTCV